MDISGVMLGATLGLMAGLRYADPNFRTPIALLKEIGSLVAFALALFCGALVIDRLFYPLPIAVYPALLLSLISAFVVGCCLRIVHQMWRQRRRR